MNIITKKIFHTSQEGTQILLISSTKNGHQSELMELFTIDKILQLCNNQGEKERIKELPTSINEIDTNRIICLGTEGTNLDDLISWIETRFYIITHRTNLKTQMQQFLEDSICIITQYDDMGSNDDIKALKTMIMDFAKTTPK